MDDLRRDFEKTLHTMWLVGLGESTVDPITREILVRTVDEYSTKYGFMRCSERAKECIGKKGEPGTVIRATFLAFDLATAFRAELKRLQDDALFDIINHAEVPTDAWNDREHPFWFREESAHYIDDVMSILDTYAPDGYYFGAHPGDSSDFGYWENEEEEDVCCTHISG